MTWLTFHKLLSVFDWIVPIFRLRHLTQQGPCEQNIWRTPCFRIICLCLVWLSPLKVCRHNHHHHHNHFRALFSSTEGWAFWQVFLEGVLSTQNGSEGQQNPYLASFCHSPALHPMISLACQIFSVQPHSACVLLQSSLCCALHVQTISSYWCGAPHLSPGCQALWEGSLS